jgi:hypothetical protein
VDAVEGEDHHDDEVGDEQGDIEGVPAVDVAEGVVGVVGLPVVSETALGAEVEGKRVEVVQQGRVSGVSCLGMILLERRPERSATNSVDGNLTLVYTRYIHD